MKYKQFIAGFVTCVILLSAIFITGFAEGLTVLLNPYPVTINGVEIAVEAYNINGFTFLKLADVGKAIPNTTIKFNEIDKRIEINSAGSVNPTSEQITSSEGVNTMSIAAAIEYDSITGLPVGAIYIENEKNGKQYKTIQYNGEIYISIVDLKNIFGIQNMFVDGFGIRFTKNEQLIPVDSNDKSNHFFAGSRLYYKKILFENYMGE
jgi:hypothetical protein